MGQSYLDSARRLREAFAKHELGLVLHWVYDAPVAPEVEGDFYLGVRNHVATIEPTLEAAMQMLGAASDADLRRGFQAAMRAVRDLARAVAAGQPSRDIPIRMELRVEAPEADENGKPRRAMSGSFADALTWAAVRLFSEVPRSLIRACAHAGCPRVYVAVKNQKFCPAHQQEAARQAQRRAERAFGARAKKARRTR